MNNLLNTILLQKEELNQLISKNQVSRAISPEVKKALLSPLVKVITGPRRAGKSTLALQILKGKKFGYLNFEDETLPSDLNGDELVKLLDDVYDSPEILFFDEIQNLSKWEQFINKLHRRGRNLLITGSNSKLLSGELASALTGRHIAFELLPFSFSEYLTQSPGIYTSPGAGHSETMREFFNTYLERGGFPEVLLGQTDAQSYLKALFTSTISLDIVQRHRIRNPAAIHNLLAVLMSSPASRFSGRSLAKNYPDAPSIATIHKYLSYAKDAYLIFDLQPFFAKTRQRMKADRKLYTIDHGYIRAVSTGVSEARSAIHENIVFVELMRRGFRPNESLFYYQTKKGYEVDFMARTLPTECILIQGCYELSSQKTLERELRAISEAATELSAKECFIITHNEERGFTRGDLKISAVPVWKWCIT